VRLLGKVFARPLSRWPSQGANEGLVRLLGKVFDGPLSRWPSQGHGDLPG